MEWFVNLLEIFPNNPLWYGFIGGSVIVLFNTFGALFILFFGNVSQRFLDLSLGFAAGVMLAASFTSLIIPGIEIGGILPVLTGIFLGAFTLDVLDRLIPHEHIIKGREGVNVKRVKGVLLFIIAITIHNAPEGLAVGVAFGSGKLHEAITLMLAIGIQNIPEGLAVSFGAMNAGFGRKFYAFYTSLRSGFIELPLAIMGAVLVHTFKPILPYAMGFAAGAMLFVISDEIIPETHRFGHEKLATYGLMIGLIIMLFLDVTLG
mgnify:CR=1 FL=1|jgi:Predicted divalent heavy-metal cations transporter